MVKAPEKRCPACGKPIAANMAFCRPHWFELPTPIRDQITAAAVRKNFLEKSRAMSAALAWFSDKRAGVQARG